MERHFLSRLNPVLEMAFFIHNRVEHVKNEGEKRAN